MSKREIIQTSSFAVGFGILYALIFITAAMRTGAAV